MPTKSNWTAFAWVVAGLFVTLFGLVGSCIGFLGLIDPEGSKLSDDSDPLGEPTSVMTSLVIIVLFGAISALGLWMVSRSDKQSDPTE